MDFSDIFRMVNFAVAVFVVLGGVAKLFPFNDFGTVPGLVSKPRTRNYATSQDLVCAKLSSTMPWLESFGLALARHCASPLYLSPNSTDDYLSSNIILGVYLIIFGLGTALLEFQIPQQVARYASFMFSFLGRGIFYIFIGSVIVGERWFRIVPGTIVGIIGVAYAALEFIPSIEPPANMRDADAGWGAEQV
ncbi:COPI associated [Stemphylium lycopersici]|uniref:COPI associated n=1 Tax=Stemphylium lycopersici TaxID=183478 RepID=A0A364NAA7_STELY|nr:COPI associated [Stemphylium lycopersici]RAR13961.1 COPI associated [Stemphylium lycopersici]